ncbi:hypothetical protein GH714_038452 [Hevea brasiliensis]|uniref:Clu domain-containing protein n=1 Tax=Hevea brasiliensis TaxID=3981 RepID=A0A6A6MPQ6_HEVBR|nr:hypothetical protein GH714_038452 [Hevea brasiliensis]
MAPRNNRGKAKGEKKKKDEKVLPVVIDITVNLPDETRIVLKGLRLKDTVDVSALKPCVLTLTEEDYDEELAVAHVRRLLDILACTMWFGRSASKLDKSKSDLERMRLVKLCNGKLVQVEACRKGFYNVGKLRILCHDLVDLLRRLSRAFDNAYDDLMKAFSERNKVKFILLNLLSLLSLSLSPSQLVLILGIFLMALEPTHGLSLHSQHSHPQFSLLPVEDELWGGNGGGLGRDGKNELIPWASEFLFLASMPCKTADERQDRDRKAFLLHSLFVDIAIFRAIKAVQHDIATLGIVNVRYCGYVAVVKVEGREEKNVSPFQSIELEQPEGGANALNINSLRLLLHRTTSSEHGKPAAHLQTSECEELIASQAFVERMLEESLAKLEQEALEQDYFVRWELGACWIQHLQDQKNTEKDKKPPIEKSKKLFSEKEMKVEGLGTPLRSLKSNKKKIDESNMKMQSENSRSSIDGVIGEVEYAVSASMESQLETTSKKNELALQRLLSDAAFTRLKESDTGLHCKSLQELVDMSQKYYTEVALPKLVADFGSLELSPVDGRTLTDFMHTRGLRMRSLGHVVKLSEKLSHVQSLCIHEMIVRAYKHILQAVIASVADHEKMAVSIAAALNLMLGVPENRDSDKSCHVHSLVWRWLEVFLKKRYEWDLCSSSFKDVRKIAILRGLCHKVGIELVPRDFDMDSLHPFQKSDIVSLVPVHKQAACSSADGRQLLESSKTALDKGKLEDAVTYGSKALAKLVAVCGPYHRMTAGAYSLLAVVLYHTGDFNQATIYQQKALDINERELGLDHPDTMKSYGDLAVFYYRLQHTELALKYVKRALYLLHLTCGPSHPNTAATYINVAMMEEGLGNVHVALRYLHKALKCNQRLLGPDHIQTAASYHAIAIALSLMEAYPLSVQHEQTTLQILRAKLGPDDLRTQDAAAWLEYFESKAFEQQEATRNGTKKPDASIASKGHLSVSDLLDYINPSCETRGRDCVSVKRKSYTTKIKEKTNPNVNVESCDESPKETLNEASDEEMHTPVASQETSSAQVQFQQTISEETAEKKSGIPNEALLETHAEVDDGWQPVQRPRSASSYGRRLKQWRGIIGKVYQKKIVDANMDYSPVKNTHQNSRYYLLKKRALSHGSYVDHHATNPSQGTKYGRRILKAVTYRVKSIPSANKTATTENSRSDGKAFALSLESSSSSAPTDVGPVKNSIVSLGKSPSYKEVALAPPGTIAKFQVWFPQSDIPDNREIGVGKHEEEINEATETVVEVSSLESESGVIEVHEVLQNGSLMDSIPNSIDSPSKESPCEKDSTQFGPQGNSNSTLPQVEDLKDKSLVINSGETHGLPNKKLSASAAPFNPSPYIGPAPVTVNIPLLSGSGAVPAVAPWPVNMTLHSGPATVLPTVSPLSSPHHPNPSAPPTPNMMRPLPFIYPPYRQSQAVPTSTFPVTSNAFHPNHFSWHCNVNSHVSEFIPSTVWPGCCGMEFSVPPPVAEPIPDPMVEPKVQFENPESTSPPPVLPADIDNVGEAKKEMNLLASGNR